MLSHNWWYNSEDLIEVFNEEHVENDDRKNVEYRMQTAECSITDWQKEIEENQTAECSIADWMNDVKVESDYRNDEIEANCINKGFIALWKKQVMQI